MTHTHLEIRCIFFNLLFNFINLQLKKIQGVNFWFQNDSPDLKEMVFELKAQKEQMAMMREFMKDMMADNKDLKERVVCAN